MWRLWGTMIALVVIFVEVASYGIGRYLQSLGIFYAPLEIDSSGYADYLARRDPVLGWPAPREFGRDGRDETGSRQIPAYRNTRDDCVSLYGDSFTWSSEVEAEHAWSNVLSKLRSCRVANYGVGGYGTDQAYLRFLNNTKDHAPIVILGHVPENILRNVNQYRDLLYGGSAYSLKPRFLLQESGALQAVTLPNFTEAEFRRVVERPEDYLPHEWFLPGGPSGLQRLGFPYTLSVLGAFRHFHVIAKLSGRPWHADFYRPDHPAGGLQLTAAILTAFHEEALARGRRSIILVIPTGHDLTFFRKNGEWVFEPLLKKLRASGIVPVNAGEGILGYLGERDPCELFHNCSAHFNKEGYAALASVVHRFLQERIAPKN